MRVEEFWFICLVCWGDPLSVLQVCLVMMGRIEHGWMIRGQKRMTKLQMFRWSNQQCYRAMPNLRNVKCAYWWWWFTFFWRMIKYSWGNSLFMPFFISVSFAFFLAAKTAFSHCIILFEISKVLNWISLLFSSKYESHILKLWLLFHSAAKWLVEL